MQDNMMELVDFEVAQSGGRSTLALDDFLDAEDDAERLSKYCRHVTFAQDSVIFEVGDHSDEFYIILSGQVDFYFPNGNLDLSLTPGNLFGYVDCQLGKSRTQIARTAFDSVPVLLAAISTASLDRMGSQGKHCNSPSFLGVQAVTSNPLFRNAAPALALKLMKVLLRQSSLELSQVSS